MAAILFRRASLHEALGQVGKVQPWQRDIRTPGMVRIEAKDGVATLSCVAFGMQAQVKLACEGHDGEMTVPFNSLVGLVEKNRGDTVQLDGDDTSVRFSGARTTSTLPVDPNGALPLRPTLDGVDRQSMDVTALRAGLAAAVPATIDDATRPALAAVYMHHRDGSLLFEAQDGNRFHKASQASQASQASALIPGRAARIILGLLPEDGTASVAISDRAIEVSAGDVTFQCALVEAGYPTGRPAPGTALGGTLTGTASELLADLDLVVVASDQRLRDFSMRLGKKSSVSTFRSAGSGLARGHVDLEAKWVGEALEIGFQFGLVRDALQLFGNDIVEWRMCGPMDATTITSPARPGIEVIVSPCRPAADSERLAA
jgi:DNA polymerase III sliding clamp (beta) subunit (PCNA family)